MTTTKKTQQREPIKSMLNVWNAHKWEEYKELDPTGKNKAKGIFKEVIFKMSKTFCYNFALTQQEYLQWRGAKPSFVKGQ